MRLKAHSSLDVCCCCCFILFWEALTTAKQNYSIKITILCVSLKKRFLYYLGDFTEDKNEREWRRKARDSGDLEVKTSISNFVWQPQQQGILRTYSVPVNYKCAFLWHVTSSLIVKFIIWFFFLHIISWVFKRRIVFLLLSSKLQHCCWHSFSYIVFTHN